MVAKFVVFFAVTAATTASDFSSFIYNVADPYINDFKTQLEVRANRHVLGQYSMLETDSSSRRAADISGFNAVRKDHASIAAAPEQMSDPSFRSFPIRGIAPAPIFRTLSVRPVTGPIIRTLPFRPIAPGPIFRTLPFRSIYPVPIYRSYGPITSACISRILSFGANPLAAKIRNIVSPFLYSRHY